MISTIYLLDCRTTDEGIKAIVASDGSEPDVEELRAVKNWLQDLDTRILVFDKPIEIVWLGR